MPELLGTHVSRSLYSLKGGASLRTAIAVIKGHTGDSDYGSCQSERFGPLSTSKAPTVFGQ